MVFARACAAIGLVGAALVAVGSFGPWASFEAFSASGLDRGADGWITLVLAILAAGVLAGIFAPKPVARVVRWIPLPFPLMILLIALLNLADIDSAASAVGVELSVGWGLWLVMAGSIAIGVASVFLMFAPMPVPAHRTRPVPTPYVPGSVAPPGWVPQHPAAYPYPPQPYPGSYPPQPHPGSYPPQPHPVHPPQGQASVAPAPPAWPTSGPAYPGSTGTEADSSG